MLITIYDSAGNPKVDLSPNDSSTQVKEVQGDSVLSLSFTYYAHIELDVDDYADFLGERFWLTEKYRPRQNSRKEWVYDLKLYGVESMIKRLLVIKTVDNEDNPVFTLTAPPRDHVAMIVKCMNDGMGNITDWKVGQVNGTENIVVDYFGKYCDEALKEIAEKVGAEWWVEGQTVNICKCEHGEPVELGYNKGLLSIDPGTADNVKFYTRLYPVGSSRNIDREKYGFSRLQLPNGQKYVEINADKYGRVDHFEESAFEGIYPRRTGTVSSVRSEVRTGEDGNPFTIYYFTDNSLPFDPNDYMIGGLVIRVSFQEGSELAGLGEEDNGTYFFEVNFNSSTREFEIITIWPYDNDIQLPGDKLVPKAGDKYILWNLRMPDEYYALAEEEFLAAVNQYNADHNLDITVYKAPTNHVWIEDNAVELTIGRRVRLESEEYFPGTGFRESRITRITRKVNLPTSMDIEISDALSRTSQEKMADSIADVRSYARSIGEGINLPDIIRTGDRTRATDNNLLSALRSYRDLMRKDRDDRSPYMVASDMGFDVGEFLASVSGGRFGKDVVTGQTFLEVDRIFARVRAYFESLTVIEAATLAGKHYVTPGGSIKCTKVEEVKDEAGDVTAYRCYFLSEQDGEKTETKIITGDQAISEMFNAKTGTANKVSNHRYWRLVTGVSNEAYTDDSGNRYGYVELSATDCESGSDIPKEGDVIEQFGNRTDRTRQSAIVFSTVDSDSPSIKLFTGIGSGETNAEHYSLDGRDIISQGYDPEKGHAYMKCYGDTYIGAPDGSTYIKYDIDENKTKVKADIEITSTIGGKSIDQYFGEKATEATDKYKYLAESLEKAAQDSTYIKGGLVLTTMIALGYTEGEARHILSGMNGSYNAELGGRTIASWYGGSMLDLFNPDGTRKTTAQLTGQEATSLTRMDGSAYYASGNVGFEKDGSGWLAGDNITWDASGAITFGNGIKIDLGGGNNTTLGGISDSLSSVIGLVNTIGNHLIPTYLDGGVYKETTWAAITNGTHTLAAIKTKEGFFSDKFISAKGANPDGGGSAFGLYTDWAQTPSSTDALGAVLGKSLYTKQNEHTTAISGLTSRVTALEGKNYLDSLKIAVTGTGNAVTSVSQSTDKKKLTFTKGSTFLTGITKAMVEGVLTGNITSHTHSQYLTTTSASSTYLSKTDAGTTYLKKTDASSTYVAKEAGKGLSTNDFTTKLLNKLNGIAEGANKYIHPSHTVRNIAAAAGLVLASVSVDAQGHVTDIGSKTLTAADIPTLAISKVSGLQDALNAKAPKSDFDTLKTWIESMFVKETDSNSPEGFRIKAKYGLYSNYFISAKGASDSSGGAGSGGYNRLDAWADYTSDKAGYVLSAGLGYDLHTRLLNVYGKTTIDNKLAGIYTKTEADGRYVTALGTNGNYLTWTRNGSTNNLTVPYATTAATLTGTTEHTGTTLADFDTARTRTYQATTDLGDGITYSAILSVSAGSSHRYFQIIGGKGNVNFLRWRTTDANGATLGAVRRLLDESNYSSVLDSHYALKTSLTSHTGNTTVHITAAERTKWNKVVTDFAAITGTDSDTIINKWEEVVAFLDTYTEADTLAGLLGNKADKATTITAGTGLSGGGSLAANRTLSLAASGVTAGTYFKTTVDTYGRVTSGSNPTTISGFGITDAYTKTEADGKYVNLTGAQTITGEKKFTSKLIVSGDWTNDNGLYLYEHKDTTVYGGYVLYGKSDKLHFGTWNNSETGVDAMEIVRGSKDVTFLGKIVKSGGTSTQFLKADGSVDGTAYLPKSTFDTFKTLFDSMFEKVTTNGVTTIRAKFGLWTNEFLSAKGQSSDSGSAGGGLIQKVYGSSDLGKTFADTTLTDTFNAYTINSINTNLSARITSLEGGSALSVTTTGNGNAITAISKSGTVITATKGATFLTAHQSLADYFKRGGGETMPAAYVDLTTSVSGNANYKNFQPGTYQIARSGYSDLVVNLALNSGSTSALQFLTNYNDNADLKYRKTIDSNRVSGPWRKILTELNTKIENGVITINGTSITPLTSHQSLANYVTLNGAQTISGAKTFTGLLTIGTAGAGAPSATVEKNLVCLHPVAHSGGPWYINSQDTSTLAYLRILYKATQALRLRSNGELTAASFVKSGGTASQVLMADGSVQTHWKSADVTSATSDVGMITPLAMNNWVSNNFYKKTDADSRFVNVSGDTMTGALQININNAVKHLGFGRAGYNYICATSSGGILGFVANGKAAGTAAYCDLIVENNAVHPGTTNVTTLGTSALRWSNVYATTLNVTSTSLVSNLNADLLDGFHKESFDGYRYTKIDASALDNNTWYPVVFRVPKAVQTRVRVEGGSAANASWNSRTDKQMAVFLDYTVQGSEWGWVTPQRVVNFIALGAGATGSNCVAGLGQLTNNSWEYVMVRGGAVYNFYISHWVVPELKTSTFTNNSQSIAPTTTSPAAITRNNAWITDNVASATKLQTARTLWGQSFNGTANVDGAMTINYTGETGILLKRTEAGSGAFIRFCNNNQTANYFRMGMYGAGYFGVGYNGTDAIAISTANNVGIGTASPAYKLDVNGGAIVRGWVRTTGANGWYNETYGGGWFMNDTTYIKNFNSKRLQIVGLSDYYGIWLNGSGLCCEGYAGASWNQGHGAVNVGIDNNSSQTPLMVAYRKGSAAAHTGANRLFAMELLNSGTHLRFGFGGAMKYEFSNAGQLTVTSLKIGSIIISYDSTNGGLHISGGGLYSDSYISAKGVSTASGGTSAFGLYTNWAQTPLSTDALGAVLGKELYNNKLDKSAGVTALGVNGNFLTWTKNDSTNNLTVPYATTANKLINNNALTYGATGLQWFNISGTKGCVAKVNDTPTNGWWHILRFNHANTSGYYTDLAVPFNSDSLYWKCVRNGGLAHDSWIQLLDTNNYSTILDGRYYTETEVNTKLTNGSVTKVGTATVGGTAKPIYLNAGTPTALSATVGADNRPVYLNAGTITAGTYTFGNASGNAPISNGTVNTNLNADLLDGWHAGGQTGSVLKKSGYVTSATAGLSNYWVKLATIAAYNDSNDRDVTLYIHSAYDALYGVLALRARSSATSPGYAARMLEGNIPTDRIRLYRQSSTGTVYEVWVNVVRQYGVFNAKVISETGRTSAESGSIVTLYNTSFTAVQTPTLTEYVNPTYLSLLNNVSSATKLQTARTINGTSFDGSANITTALWGTARNIYIADSTAAHTSAAVSVNGSGNATLKLPAEIALTKLHLNNGQLYYTSNDQASAVGGTLNNLVISSWYGVSFTTSCGGQTYTGTNAVSINCRSGNVYAARFNGPLTGAVTGNATTATTLQTTRTLWGQNFNGGGNVSGSLSSVGNITGSGAMTISSTNGRLTLNGAATALDLKFANTDAKSVILNGTAFKPYDAADNALELGTDAARWKKITACNMRLSSSTSGSGADVYAELWRGGAASWKILNTGGVLKFQSNYTTAAGDYFDCMTLSYNTGNAYIKGSVGVGTTNPQHKLDVNGNIRAAGWLRTTGATGWINDTYGGGLCMTDATWVRIYGSKSFYQASGILRTDGTLQVGNAGTYLNVASGGMTLGVNLDLKSGHAIHPSTDKTCQLGTTTRRWSRMYAAAVCIGSNGTETDEAALQNTTFVGGGYMELYRDTPFIDFHFGNSTADYTSRIIEEASGRLAVIGTLRVSVGMYSDGYVSAKGQSTTSDERLKQVLRPVYLNVKDIAAAPSVEFVWKKDGVKDVGSIAQYWEKLMPQLVNVMPDGMKGLQYGKAALMGVIAVARKTESLESRVERLEKENRELKRELETIKRR